MAEMAYDFTPYRYGFNNPVFFSDALGLFESYSAAQNWIDTYGLSGANIFYNKYKDHYEIENEGYSFYQKGNDIVFMKFYSMDSGLEVNIIKGGAGAGGENRNDNAIGNINLTSWSDFNNSFVFSVNGVAGIFETGAVRASVTATTQEAKSIARITKIAGNVSIAGNISLISYASYQFIDNPTLGNATRVGIQGTIIALEYGLNAWVPGLGILVGVSLSVLEAKYGQDLYDYIDNK